MPDANAAAAMFLRERMPHTVDDLLVDAEAAPLARSLTPPGRPETLLIRMVAFLYLYEDLCAALAATWAIGFEEHLDEIAPGAALYGGRLEAASTALEPDPDRQPLTESAWGDEVT